MKLKIFSFLVPPIIIIFFLFNCAKRMSPTGGEKDVRGPKIVTTIPGNKSTNFHGNKVYFEFDEHIKEDNLLQKIIISPAIDSTFTFKVIKKKLFITFNKKLKDNTTYTVNLGAAIKDITEGNPALDSKLVFSTGQSLDSLNVSGNVSDLETGKPAKEILVGLYYANDTITPFNGKPTYISRTDEKGNYSIENLASRKYIIYAISDINRDLKYSNQNELIGFESDTVELKEFSIKDVSIKLSKFDLRKLRVSRSSPEKEYTTVELNKGLTDVALYYPTDTSKRVYFTIAKEQNKLNIYNSNNYLDSIPLHLTAIDSFDIKVDTTIKILFQKEELKKNSKKEKEQLARSKFSARIQPAKSIMSTSEIEIQTELPIIKLNIKGLYFYKDSLTTYPLETKDITWNETRTNLKISKNIPFLDTIRMYLDSGALLSIKNDSNSISKTFFVKKKSEEYSSIGGTIKLNAENFIIQLTKKENKKVFEIRNKKNFKFDFLEPGTYSIRILIDENGNGKWDKGDLKNRIEPEKIVHYYIVDNKGNRSNEISLKANWELLDNVISE